MPTPLKGPRLGGSPQHQRLLLSNLATALFEHGRITTTQAKAKALRPLAEKLITFAKRGDIHARRQVLTVVRDKSVVHTLFAEIGPRFAERAGGYTRITKVMPRKGDNAPMAVIELVESTTIAQQAVGEAERARGTKFAPRRSKAAAPAAGPAADETVADETVADETAVDETAVDETAVDETAVDETAVEETPPVVEDKPVEPVVADEGQDSAAAALDAAAAASESVEESAVEESTDVPTAEVGDKDEPTA